MHHTATETPSPGHATPWRGDGDANTECDYCGRLVRRESALEHSYRRGDGVEFVPVCPECELAAD